LEGVTADGKKHQDQSSHNREKEILEMEKQMMQEDSCPAGEELLG
jgi:hypothetical protein